MIELFRHYWWVALIAAAGVVVVTHAGLVKLIAHLERKSAETPKQD